MKYGREMTETIAKELRTGSNRTDACVMAGISYETFTVWMQKPEFSDAIKKAEVACKNRNIKIIQKAAITTWQAAAWFLERRYRDEYALKHLEPGEKPRDPESARAVDAALRALKLMEEASKHANTRASSGRHTNGVENGASGLQAPGPAAPGV